MQTSLLSRTSVVDELAAELALRRSTAAQRSAAYWRLASAILDPAASMGASEPVELRKPQPLVAAA